EKDADVLLESAELARQLAASPASSGEAGAKARLAEARQYLQRGLELHPEDARMYETLARLEVQNGNRTEAIAWLRRGLEVLPREGALYWVLAEILVDGGEFAEVEKIVFRLRKDGVASAPLDFLGCRVLAGKGKWWEATRSLERTLPALERSPALEGL